MEVKSGTTLTCRLMPGLGEFAAAVVSSEGDMIVLKLTGRPPDALSHGTPLEISFAESGFLAEVVDIRSDVVLIRRSWSERREYFRVDDAFPVTMKKVEDEHQQGIAKIFSGRSPVKPEDLIPEHDVNPVVWKMLCDINMKLELILEKLAMGRGTTEMAEDRHVNISASGMKLTTDEKVEIGEMIEAKMYLPTVPSVGIIAFGRAVRVDRTDDGRYEVALHFTGMGDDVRDEIIQYTLKRHREIIRQQRQSGKER